MAPSRVIVLRHAEKPDDHQDPGLSPRGEVRAAALGVAFPQRFGSPSRVIATAFSAHSDRSRLTVQPLASALGVQVTADRGDEEFAVVAAQVLNDVALSGKLVVICWHHGKIHRLVQALGAAESEFLRSWPEDMFDAFVSLEYVNGDTPHMTAEPQRLLFGDRSDLAFDPL